MGQIKKGQWEVVTLCDLVKFCEDSGFEKFGFASEKQGGDLDPISFALTFDQIKVDPFLNIVGFIGQCGSVSVYGVQGARYHENPVPMLVLDNPRHKYIFTVEK